MEIARVQRFTKAVIYLLLALTTIAFSGCLSGSHTNELKSKGDIQSLTAALNDSNKDTRSQAAKALGILMAGKGQKEDPNLALANYGSIKTNSDPSLDQSVNALIRALNDIDQDVRIEAIKAIGEIGDRRAVDPLVQELKDSNSLIRANSAEALGNIGLKTKAAIPLFAALKDSDPAVKTNAETALKAMGLEPYPAPRTGTYLLGEPYTSQFGGWVLYLNNTGQYNGIFEISDPGEKPYVAVFIRAGDTYNIDNVPPGDDITATFGDNWDRDQGIFTKNVYAIYIGKAIPIRRSTQRYEW